MKNNFKLIIICINTILLLAIFISGYLLMEGKDSFFWHITLVGIFFISLFIHILLRKKRLAKMIKEAFQKNSCDNKYDYHMLLESLSNCSIDELSQSLQINKNMLESLFMALNVEIESFQETLNSIAKNNEFCADKLLIIIIGRHLQIVKKEKKWD